jgi:hypothetical protein
MVPSFFLEVHYTASMVSLSSVVCFLLMKREQLAVLGGEARARALSAERRSAIARLGAVASWAARKKAMGAKALCLEMTELSRLGVAANRLRVARLLRDDPEALRAEMARRGRLGGRPKSATGNGPKERRQKAKKARRLKDGG